MCNEKQNTKLYLIFWGIQDSTNCLLVIKTKVISFSKINHKKIKLFTLPEEFAHPYLSHFAFRASGGAL